MKHSLFSAMSLLTLILAGGSVHAQTLSLSPLTTASANGIVTFSVVLSDGTNDTSTLGLYDFTLSADSQYLSFVTPAAPFVPAATSFNQFLANNADNATGVLHVAYATDAVTVVNEEGKAPLTLGTFQATVLKALPVGGTLLSFSAVGTGPGQTSVSDALTYGNVLQSTSGALVLPSIASAPEPSAWVSLGVGAMLLGTAAWRARRRSVHSA